MREKGERGGGGSKGGGRVGEGRRGGMRRARGRRGGRGVGEGGRWKAGWVDGRGVRAATHTQIEPDIGQESSTDTRMREER